MLYSHDGSPRKNENDGGDSLDRLARSSLLTRVLCARSIVSQRSRARFDDTERRSFSSNAAATKTATTAAVAASKRSTSLSSRYTAPQPYVPPDIADILPDLYDEEALRQLFLDSSFARCENRRGIGISDVKKELKVAKNDSRGPSRYAKNSPPRVRFHHRLHSETLPPPHLPGDRHYSRHHQGKLCVSNKSHHADKLYSKDLRPETSALLTVFVIGVNCAFSALCLLRVAAYVWRYIVLWHFFNHSRAASSLSRESSYMPVESYLR